MTCVSDASGIAPSVVLTGESVKQFYINIGFEGEKQEKLKHIMGLKL